MTDIRLLQLYIKESGMTVTALAKKLGLSREGLYLKLSGKTEFTASEIRAVQTALHLSGSQVDKIFLHPNGN